MQDRTSSIIQVISHLDQCNDITARACGPTKQPGMVCGAIEYAYWSSISMSCHFLREDARTHGDDDEVIEKKKCQNFLYLFWSRSLKKYFMYTNLNTILYKFIMAGANSGPPKPWRDSPACSGWYLSHARCLPNPEQGGNEPTRFGTSRLPHVRKFELRTYVETMKRMMHDTWLPFWWEIPKANFKSLYARDPSLVH
jgi:hypothetical protein